MAQRRCQEEGSCAVLVSCLQQGLPPAAQQDVQAFLAACQGGRMEGLPAAVVCCCQAGTWCLRGARGQAACWACGSGGAALDLAAGSPWCALRPHTLSRPGGGPPPGRSESAAAIGASRLGWGRARAPPASRSNSGAVMATSQRQQEAVQSRRQWGGFPGPACAPPGRPALIGMAAPRANAGRAAAARRGGQGAQTQAGQRQHRRLSCCAPKSTVGRQDFNSALGVAPGLQGVPPPLRCASAWRPVCI